MKMGRDIWMNPSSYQATSTTSCMYQPSSNQSRYRKKDSHVTNWSANQPRHRGSHRTKAVPSLFAAVWSKLLQFSSSYKLTVPLDVLMYGLVVVVCVVCYANSLDGEFVHDDMVSITTNPDVIGDNPVKEIFANDFWGKPMTDSDSHKSYRPFTVLTFR